MSCTKMSLEATKSYIVHVLPQVCPLQNGLWKLPNDILSCPSSSMSFTTWSLEATTSYIVLSLLKYVLYKMVSVSYQVIFCLVLTKVWSLEATKSYIVLTQVCLLQNCLWKLPNHILSMSFLKYVFYKMVSGSYQIIYCPCPYSSMSFTKLSLEATKSYIVLSLLKFVFYKMVSGSYQIIYCLVFPQVCLLQNGPWKLPNH